MGRGQNNLAITLFSKYQNKTRNVNPLTYFLIEHDILFELLST